jgi:hypothetical protein
MAESVMEGLIHVDYAIVKNKPGSKYKYKAHYTFDDYRIPISVEGEHEGDHKAALIETICNKLNTQIMRGDDETIQRK